MTSPSHILIVGGTRGMGFATARLALAAGHRVTISGRSDASVQAALAKLGSPQAAGLRLDLADAAALPAAFAALPAFDHLVLAGSSDVAWGPLETLSMAALLRALQVKLVGYLAAIQAALPRLAPNGSITLLGGAAARVAMPGTAGLAAVNGGLEAAARTLARELAPRRVNLVSPGLTDTEAYAGMPAEQRRGMFEAAAAALPVGRTGQPEDIASLVLALIGNGFITGAVVDVDGGAHIGR